METFRTADGRTLAYNVLGSGPTLVCHPGGPGFAGAELMDLGGLATDFQLVILDPRATGGSDPATDYQPASYAADVDELRAHLGLEQIDLLGFSHGAIVAIVYAARYPSRVGRLVLAGGLAAFTDEMKRFAEEAIEAKSDEPWHDDAVAALAEEENGELDDPVGVWLREAPLYFARWDERYRTAMVAGSVGMAAAPLIEFNEKGFDVRDELASITAPTLIVCGTDDFICGPPAADLMARGIANSRVAMIENCGHMMFIEQPAAFRDAVATFLARG